MADVKNIATPQSIRVTCAEISESAARFKNELDTWMESSRKALEDLTLSHKNTMQQIDQTNADLVKKYRTLRAESQKIQSEEEKQRQQLREVEMTIAQLKEKENIIPQQLEATRRVLQRNLQSINALRTQIDENTRVRREKHLELTKGISFYSTHLGLTFERFEDKSGQLRFTFTQIDPKDPNRPFYFIIRVIDDSYEVLDCQPPIKAMPELVKIVNRNNDLTALVRSVRANFRALVQ